MSLWSLLFGAPEPSALPAEQLPDGLVLGRRVWGEQPLPCDGRYVLLPPERLIRHVLVCGATGMGKTETALRIAYMVADQTDARGFYLDAKGDRELAERFVWLMELAGRRTRVFPNEPFDGWRGDPFDLQARLIEIVDYATEGPTAFYRDVAKACLALACQHPDGPPRSSDEFLSRLELKALRQAHAGAAGARLARALSEERVREVQLRYEALFTHTRGALDGEWAWDDADAGYLLLDGLASKEETRGLARFLFEDFAHYFTKRKPREQLCLMVVDEFAALAERAGMAGRVEQARGFNTALVLCPQVAAGMGDETERARLLGNVETVICHRINTPAEIVALAGTRLVPELSRQLDENGATGLRTARLQHQFKVDPNDVRQLDPGEAYVIAQGQAMKLRIDKAPEGARPLPPPASNASQDATPVTSSPRSVSVPY